MTRRQARLQEALLGWYADQGRDLPWRRTDDPYAVLVSEVMLQQTQVSRVLPRYEQWLRRWPTVAALAAATPADVLAEWSGLGYNSRALRLRETARAVVDAGWPPDEAGLRALPGIGTYTAAALSAFAWRRPAAALDTNQERVLDRLDAAADRTPAERRRRALTLVPDDAPDAWNHALMDLGATICTARRADCDYCPLAADCHSAGLVDPDLERAARGRRPAPKFETTARYVRGRIIAALVANGAPLSDDALAASLPSDIAAERRRAALTDLRRDGLLETTADGSYQLPG